MDESVAEATVARLRAEQPPFDWVGVYWVRGDELVLGPFVGLPTDQRCVAFGAAQRHECAKFAREFGRFFFAWARLADLFGAAGELLLLGPCF